MTLSRRQLLQGIGAGVAVGAIGVSGSASGTTTPSETRRVFVHPRNGVGDFLGVVEAIGGTTVLEYDNFDFVVAEVPANRVEDLLAASGVASVEEDDETGIPDEWSPSLLDLLLPPDSGDCSTHPEQRASWGHERIGADDVDPDGTGVGIGILDTGVQTDHCSLSVAGGQNFTTSGPSSDYEDRHGHGTHVAGVAAAADNDLGVMGAAPNANLYAVKVLDDRGRGRYSELIAGIDWCMSNDVEIVSMSLGGETESAAVDEALQAAHAAGHLLVSAAGNEGNAGDGSCDEETMTYPATHDDVVAVAAMNEDDTLASYSSVGSAVELLAPGTNVASTFVGNEYAKANGTSVACPFVSGVAALVWERVEADGPGPNEAVRRTLAETAETVLGTCEEGHGLVDARAAVSDDRATSGDDGEREGEHGGGADGENGGVITGGPASVLDRAASALQRFVDVVVGILERLRELFR
ncbi:S8 family peptidase [Natrononativus amylolyticus]|uniref:S8 family peptidase n=1 Tax=Natrononativus amylolyticus TaxID=2963434 RepID=UPI0020CF5623|nr:S8 family peptidase [Natrononativus amylolyticus]